MYRFRHSVISGFIAVALVLPGIASAQTTDSLRLQLLQELVAALQEQLQQLLEDRQVDLADDEESDTFPISDAVFYDDDSFLEDIDADIVARYRIRNMTIDSPSDTHEQYVLRMRELVPEEYHQYYVELVVFESGRDDIDAFVETILPYDGEWRYGVSIDAIGESLHSDSTAELIVHEFAHLFSLHEVFTSPTPSNCHEYFEDRGGCVSPNTLYGRFLDEFWDDERLDRASEVQEVRSYDRALNKFYRENDHEFVSRYAASSPAEDFAESFANYVLYDDDIFGNVASEKVSFFNRFSSTHALKEEILSDI